MSRLGFALSVLAIVAVAAWAYNVNYRTGEALARVETLRSEIARTREDVQVLRVEWAWLNTPERLARLVAVHQDKLALGPMVPERFGDAQQVPFPPPPDHDPLESALMAALSGAERSILAQSTLPDQGAAPPAEPDPRLLPLLEDAPARRLVPVALGPRRVASADLAEPLADPAAAVSVMAVETGTASQETTAASGDEGARDASAALAAAIDAAVASVVAEPAGDTAGSGATLGAPLPAPGPAVTQGLARVVEAGGGAKLPAEPSTRGSEPSAAFLRQMSASQAAPRQGEEAGE
ncbi:MAG: hypothetical protein AAFP17_06475 [Pseudomonadota bacterium]